MGVGGIKNKLKTRDVGEGHPLSISAGHQDIPVLSVTPQDSNSAEWASLPRPSLLPSKATATVPHLQLLSPLPILHPRGGRAAPCDPSLLHPGRERGSSSLLLPASGTGAPHPLPLLHPGRERGSQSIPLSCTLAGRALPQGPRGTCAAKSALTARAGPRDTEGTLRQNDPAGFRAQREDM